MFLTIKILLFHDNNSGINKQVMGTEKVMSFFPTFSDTGKLALWALRAHNTITKKFRSHPQKQSDSALPRHAIFGWVMTNKACDIVFCVLTITPTTK